MITAEQRAIAAAKSKRAPTTLLHPSFVYVQSRATDVSLTWRKYGWRPKHETDKQAANVKQLPKKAQA